MCGQMCELMINALTQEDLTYDDNFIPESKGHSQSLRLNMMKMVEDALNQGYIHEVEKAEETDV